MRILLVTGKFPPEPCGVGDYTARLAAELARRGHEVGVFSSKSGLGGREMDPEILAKPLADATERVPPTIFLGERGGTRSVASVSVSREAERWDGRDIGVLLEEARRWKPDVLHVQYQSSGFHDRAAVAMLPRRLAGSGGCRMAVTFHELAGPVRWLPAAARRLWLLPMLWSADAVIVCNERHRRLLARVPGVARRLERIPLPANIDRVEGVDRAAVRRELGVGEGEFLLARFGFLHNPAAHRIPRPGCRPRGPAGGEGALSEGPGPPEEVGCR